MSLVIYAPSSDLQSEQFEQPSVGSELRRLFDFRRAYRHVEQHIAVNSNAENDNTLRAYMPSLQRFLKFLKHDQFILDEVAMHEAQLRRRTVPDHVKAHHETTMITLLLTPHPGDSLPTEDVLRDYIADMSETGLKSSTISRHLAAVKHFMKSLASQPTPPHLLEPINPNNVNFQEYIALQEIRDAMYKGFIETQKSILAATDISAPKKKTIEESGLMSHGERLEPEEVELLLSQTAAPGDLESERDALLLLIGLNTALRASELTKVTRNSIKRYSNRTYKVKVRGKRNKMIPVSIPAHVVHRIDQWTERWNEQFEPGDDRIIGPNDPVLQPLDKYGFPYEFHRARDGISYNGLRTIVQKHSLAILGKLVNLHDLRRTWAYIAYRYAGKTLEAVSRQLRHESIETTRRYIGVLEDYDEMNIAEGENGFRFDW